MAWFNSTGQGKSQELEVDWDEFCLKLGKVPQQHCKFATATVSRTMQTTQQGSTRV